MLYLASPGVPSTTWSAVTRGAALSAVRVSPVVWSWAIRLFRLSSASSEKVRPEK